MRLKDRSGLQVSLLTRFIYCRCCAARLVSFIFISINVTKSQSSTSSYQSKITLYQTTQHSKCIPSLPSPQPSSPAPLWQHQQLNPPAVHSHLLLPPTSTRPLWAPLLKIKPPSPSPLTQPSTSPTLAPASHTFRPLVVLAASSASTVSSYQSKGQVMKTSDHLKLLLVRPVDRSHGRTKSWSMIAFHMIFCIARNCIAWPDMISMHSEEYDNSSWSTGRRRESSFNSC